MITIHGELKGFWTGDRHGRLIDKVCTQSGSRTHPSIHPSKMEAKLHWEKSVNVEPQYSKGTTVFLLFHERIVRVLTYLLISNLMKQKLAVVPSVYEVYTSVRFFSKYFVFINYEEFGSKQQCWGCCVNWHWDSQSVRRGN